MRITPIDDDTFRRRGPWRGWFPCLVIGCVEGTSRAGNAYLRCEVEVTNGEDRRTLTDYLMAEGAMAWRLRGAADAFRALERYQAGLIEPSDFIGRRAYLRLGVQGETRRTVIHEYAAEPPSTAHGAKRDELRELMKTLKR